MIVRVLSISLTKYCKTFSEVKGYFGICGCNNQLVVVDADLVEEAVEVNEANWLDETNEANVADKVVGANEAIRVNGTNERGQCGPVPMRRMPTKPFLMDAP